MANFSAVNNPVMKDLSGFLKESQLRSMYNVCDTLRDKVLIRLLWKSGRRISEVLRIKVSDIDFEKKNILWNILKKRNPMKKWKPIDKWTLELLSYYILESKLEPNHYLIHSGYPTQKPLTRQGAFKIIRKLGHKAGIDMVGEKRIHPHHFRHSFAVSMAERLKSPADVRKLQMYLEHSSLGMTEQYLQFNEQDLRELMEEDIKPDNYKKEEVQEPKQEDSTFNNFFNSTS